MLPNGILSRKSYPGVSTEGYDLRELQLYIPEKQNCSFLCEAFVTCDYCSKPLQALPASMLSKSLAKAG